MRRVPLVVMLVCSAAHAEPKNHKTAQWLSGGGVAVSSALVVGGFAFAGRGETFNMPLLWSGIATSVVSPSLGEWYAGEWVTIGMAVRVTGAGIASFAIAHQQYDTVCLDSTSAAPKTCRVFNGTGIVLLGLAAIAFVGGAAYDVADAPEAVDRYNAHHGFAVTPMPMAGPQGLVPGVSIAGYF